MRPSIRFTFEERKKIEGWVIEGRTWAFMGDQLNRHKKSVYNEVKTRSQNGIYLAEVAQQMVADAQASRIRKLQKKFNKDEVDYILSRRREGIGSRIIASEINTSDKSVLRIIKKFGENEIGTIPVIALPERVGALEQQVTLLFEIIKEMKYASQKN
jgi:IS30 family transposase